MRTLQTRATNEHLSQSDEWRALVHYERNWLRSGVHSTVSSPWFFLAAHGETRPATELKATIAALFSKKPIGPRQKPTWCLFVARRKFLVSSLNIDTQRLPDFACPDYKHWRQKLSPRAVSLIFPTAFPDSPSSMFGHTLLRIDSSHRRHGTELLSFAVNFAASAGDDKHGLKFAFKGLTGGYPGIFGLFPYYRKVKQYAWIENRDIWSYRLKLTATERSRLIDHIWAMDHVHFKYYFLTKNCAYQLLSLLDVARPGLHLTADYNWYAIPSDTIRTLARTSDILGPAQYRPSMKTILQSEAGQLPQRDLELAKEIANRNTPMDSPRLKGLSRKKRAETLEVAGDYLHYELASNHIEAKAGRAHVDAILAARSRIPIPSPFAPPQKPDISPDEGHGSTRLAVSTIYADHNLSLGLRLRPAYHDLLDAPGGYTDGAQINFLDTGLQLDPDTGRLRVHDLDLLNITSVSPRSTLFKPVSFTFDTGLRRRPSAYVFTHKANNLGYYFQGGPGLAWGHDTLMGYVFGLGSVDANSALQPAYAIGTGARAGVLVYPARGVQTRVEAGAIEYIAGDDGYYRWAQAAAQFPLFGSLAFRIGLRWQDTAVDRGLRTEAQFRAYF